MAREYKYVPDGKYRINEEINNKNVQEIMSGNATTRDRKSLASNSKWREFVEGTMRGKSMRGLLNTLSDAAKSPDLHDGR